MSERRRFLTACAALLCVAAPARGQETDAWRERLRVREAEAAALEARANALSAQRDSARLSLRTAGMHVRYSPAVLTDRDTARIADGLRLGVDALVARHGEAVRPFIDTLPWQVYGSRTTRLLQPYLRLATSPRSGRREVSLARPVRPDAVAYLVQERAGAAVLASHPGLRPFENAHPLTGMSKAEWFTVARGLQLSWAAVGRRCAAGRLDACREYARPFQAEGALERLYDRADVRMLASIGELPPTADSALFVSRQRCREGADTACARVLPFVRIPDPIHGVMRGSVATHAFELGGPAALQRVATAPAEPLAALAHIAGIPEDSLIRSWRARVDTALDEGRASAPVVFLSTAAWCGLLLFGVTRRRPTP